MRLPPPPLLLLLGALLCLGCSIETQSLYDFDEDGSLDQDDCNPADPAVYPGAPEILDDGIDQDCDGADGDADDLDADSSSNDDDCAPFDASIYPGAADSYGDDIDQNCDGSD